MYKIQIKTKNIDEFRLWTHRYGIIFYVNENKKARYQIGTLCELLMVFLNIYKYYTKYIMFFNKKRHCETRKK